MIDERTLTDSLRCPSCGGPVSSAAACPTCAVDLSSATAARVWRVSVETATLLQERARLIDQLRSEARSGRPAPVRAAQAAIAPAPAPGLAGPRGPVPPEVLAAPRPEWTRRRVQNLLLSLGVALLAVAAVIFLVVSWSLLGIGGRATVMVGCTLLAGGAAAAAHRRGLGSTAEAVSLLTVALALLDAWGAREAGLAGFEGGDGLAYWAGALAVVAGLAAAASSVVPTRSFRVAAAVLAQLPVPLLSAHLARTADQPVAIVATGLTLWTVGALGVAAAWRSGTRSRDARLVVAAGGLLAWVAASATAVGAAYGETGSLVLGTALLLVLAGVSAASIWLGAPLAHVPTVGATAATALVVAAAWATPVDQVSDRWLPLVLSLVAVVLLGTATLVPPGRRLPPAAVTFLASLVPVVTVS
ncbi:MAG: hypothetical protein ACXV3V_09805, partial [Actinomycetes bacterium]